MIPNQKTMRIDNLQHRPSHQNLDHRSSHQHQNLDHRPQHQDEGNLSHRSSHQEDKNRPSQQEEMDLSHRPAHQKFMAHRDIEEGIFDSKEKDEDEKLPDYEKFIHENSD